jgi:nucleotide-binding universal stress UspA family protein
MLPLDGSGLAETVLPPVSELAKKLDAEMVLFRAYNIPPGFYDAGGGFAIDLDRLLAQTEADVLHYLEEKKAGLKQAGVASVTIASRQGYDADEIINYAGNRPDRLIAMCSHGRSGVRRWAVGSVAETVVRHCSSPVLVFRAPH